MSSKITKVMGEAFYLPGNNIDTDRITPARLLESVTFEGLGDNVFVDDRAKLNGAHPFDKPENKGRPILIVDDNFGTGSSRQSAVMALMQRGVKAIIGLSFAPIFQGNAVSNGLVCVTMAPKDHAALLHGIREGLSRLLVDIENSQVTNGSQEGWAGFSLPCTMSDSDRQVLVSGTWDPLGTALEAGDLIEQTAARLPYMIKIDIAA